MLKIAITDEHYDLKTTVLNALYAVTDPELGINIIDLGLVYGMTIEANSIHIFMTLSTPACPMGGIITAHVRTAVEAALPGYETGVTLVWEPQWNADLISETGKAALGW